MAVSNDYLQPLPTEKIIMNALLIQSHTIREIEDLCHLNYYTVRKILLDLEAKGVVKMIGYRHRNSKVYKLAGPGDVVAKEAIPSVRDGQGNVYKLHVILNSVGQEKKSLSGPAATAMPRIVARLFMAALRVKETDGHFPVGKQLDDIRLEMTNNLKQLEFVTKLYKTVLNNENFWDPTEIARIAYDVDFNKDDVIKAYKHYYPED